MTRTWLGKVVVLAGLCICCTAGAQTVAESDRSGGLVAYTVPVAPWTFPEEPTRGVAPEYLHYLFDAAHVGVRLDTLPYVRAVNGLRDGSNVAALLIPDADRDRYALRLCEVTQIRSGIVYKKSRFPLLTPNDLAGLTIGMQHGTHALDKLEQIPGITRYTVESVEQGLKMLQLDRLDATFLSSPGSESMLRASGMSRKDYHWLEVDVAPVVVYVSKKSSLARDAQALQRLRGICEGPGRDVMTELMRKYR